MPTADSWPSDPALTSSPRRSVNARPSPPSRYAHATSPAPLEVVGRTPLEEFQTMEQWIVGKYAYVTSIIAGRLWVYDISNPAAPVKVDSVTFDARVLNDISTTADGKVAVVTREGASNRKNGIVFLDTSRPGTPEDPVGVQRNGLGRRPQRVHRRPSRLPDR